MLASPWRALATLENARSQLSEFRIKQPRALELIRQVARTVDQWPQHFAQHGVCPADMERLQASIDRNALRLQRKAYHGLEASDQ